MTSNNTDRGMHTTKQRPAAGTLPEHSKEGAEVLKGLVESTPPRGSQRAPSANAEGPRQAPLPSQPGKAF